MRPFTGVVLMMAVSVFVSFPPFWTDAWKCELELKLFSYQRVNLLHYSEAISLRFTAASSEDRKVVGARRGHESGHQRAKAAGRSGSGWSVAFAVRHEEEEVMGAQSLLLAVPGCFPQKPGLD